MLCGVGVAWLGLRCSRIPKGRVGARWPSGSRTPEGLRPGYELDGVGQGVEAEPGGGTPARDSEGLPMATLGPGTRLCLPPFLRSGVFTDLRTELESLSLRPSGSGHLCLPSRCSIASPGRPS